MPTLINRAYGNSFFWDGRTASLEEQVLKPIQDPKELDMTLEEVVMRLSQEEYYHKEFQVAFGRAVCSEDLARALASYVRTGDIAKSCVLTFFRRRPSLPSSERFHRRIDSRRGA